MSVFADKTFKNSQEMQIGDTKIEPTIKYQKILWKGFFVNFEACAAGEIRAKSQVSWSCILLKIVKRSNKQRLQKTENLKVFLSN